MFKIFTLFFLSVFTLTVAAQNKPFVGAQPFGQIDKEDLELTSCDFEKDANAEVLFDVANIFLASGNSEITIERHVRIKIFNDFGKNEANIRIEYPSYKGGGPGITNIQGETLNMDNGKPQVTHLDKKLIYNENIDRLRSAVIFALPNAKPGSVIEYKYTYMLGYFPDWYFQSNLPTRYSEIQTDFPGGEEHKIIPHVSQPFVKDVGKPDDYKQIKALANIHSLPNEPYMASRLNSLQRMEYFGFVSAFNTWPRIGELVQLIINTDQQIDGNINGETNILNRVKTLKSLDEKIAFIFDTVKNSMKWNNITSIFPNSEASLVWKRKTGNSGEINWIVYHLLKKAGIKAYPLLVSTKQYGKLNPAIPNISKLANLVVYLPIDSARIYVLDATNKYGLFNQIPVEELNTFGLNIDNDTKFYETVFLQKAEPAMQSVFLNADINASGKMSGTAEVTSDSYNKINAVKQYKSESEEKYIALLRHKDNNLKILSLKVENMENDTLPLVQNIKFDIDLIASDENYIYFNTSLFTAMSENPFENEIRYSDIDFGYRNNLLINGLYTLPKGYKADALPKTMTIVMPDESITFKRIIAEDNGTVLVKYVLNHKKTLCFKENYQDIRGFYKKMYEMLNEQIVLKKL